MNDGLVIDLSRMNAIRIQPDEKIAHVEPGNNWQRFDKEAQKYGLVTTGGTVSAVGVAGYTLGGGTGYLARRFGLAVDNLLSAEVVTAECKRVTASDTENPGLFWAVRGGGGNFGIVTSFEFQLHPIPEQITAGQIVYSYKDADRVLRFYRRFMEDASDEITCYAFFLNVPPVDAFPQETHGKTALSLVLMHSGNTESAMKELKPLLELGNPILKAIQPMLYTEAQQMFDRDMAKGNRWYSKAHYLDALTDDAIDTILKFTSKIPGPFSVAYLDPMGGAINRHTPTETAFPHRNAKYGIHILPGWIDQNSDPKNMEWAQKFFHAMEPHSNGGVYVNLLGHDEDNRVKSAYGFNFNRLRQIKKKWDPNNIFSSNHNIKS